MSLLGKLCAVFLGWVMFGALISVIRILIIFVKLQMLDPSNDELVDDFLERVCGTLPVVNGIRFKEKFIKDVNNQIDEKLGGNRFTRFMEFVIDWPRSLAIVIPLFEETLRCYKDEYDRGIRVRKKSS